MAWLEFAVGAKPDTVEDVAALLTAAGFEELIIEDQAELEGFLEENRACWDYIDPRLAKQLEGLCQVRLYLEDADTAARDRLERLARTQGLPLTVKALGDADWETGWQDSYPPLEVGSRLIVLPYWLSEKAPAGRIPVILDPGLTFGTGAHPSTQMVMEAMEARNLTGADCLDLGSGSGILSITALALGASHALGVDIDPKARDAGRENGERNGFTIPRLEFFTGNVVEDAALRQRLAEKKWDLVLVNIVADVIIALAPLLPELLAEGADVICSGILDSRLDQVEAALTQAGLAVTERRAKEEWRCLTAGRRNE